MILAIKKIKYRNSNKQRSSRQKTNFKIYKQFPFDLNTLINAKTFINLLKIESRALIYQKFLLSDNIQNKLDLLFLLKDLLKKIIY